jgi:hypothetical protein
MYNRRLHLGPAGDLANGKKEGSLEKEGFEKDREPKLAPETCCPGIEEGEQEEGRVPEKDIDQEKDFHQKEVK